MKQIQVLGPGCSKCELLYSRTREAVESLGEPCEVVKVTDIDTMLEYGVMASPALVVDGEVRVSGRVPTVSQIRELILG